MRLAVLLNLLQFRNQRGQVRVRRGESAQNGPQSNDLRAHSKDASHAIYARIGGERARLGST